MTLYEHAMFGGTLALAAGVQRRHGGAIVGMAAVAAALPDADGLSLLFGPSAYAGIHRVWGHNLLVAGGLGCLVGAVGFAIRLSAIRRRKPDLKLQAPQQLRFSGRALMLWILVGGCAGLSHLTADLVYSGGANLPVWPVPLFWPYSNQGWALPIVPWGDLGTTLIFIAEMFAIYRWPKRAQVIACLTLVAVLLYIGGRWLALA